MSLSHAIPGDQACVPIPVLLHNSSGVSLPPFSPCEVVGAYAMPASGDRRWTDQIALTVSTFSDSCHVRSIAASSSFRILPGKIGPGYIGSVLPLNVAGTVGHSFKQTKNAFGITAGFGPIIKIDGLSPSLFRVNTEPDYLFIFTLTSEWGLQDGGLVADASIRSVTSATALVVSDKVYDPLSVFEELTIGDKGYCLLQKGKFYAIQAPCP